MGNKKLEERIHQLEETLVIKCEIIAEYQKNCQLLKNTLSMMEESQALDKELIAKLEEETQLVTDTKDGMVYLLKITCEMMLDSECEDEKKETLAKELLSMAEKEIFRTMYHGSEE